MGTARKGVIVRLTSEERMKLKIEAATEGMKLYEWYRMVLEAFLEKGPKQDRYYFNSKGQSCAKVNIVVDSEVFERMKKRASSDQVTHQAACYTAIVMYLDAL